MSKQDNPYFTRREHSYAELVSSIDWTERFIEEGLRENDREWLENGLIRFLIDQQGMKEEQARQKVKEMMDEGGIDFKKTVNTAERKGFLEDFRLNEPWHPKTFYEEEFVSYTFQHASVIVYRGMRRRFFYKASVQNEDERSRKHPTSIFNHQYLRPGSSLQQGDEQEFIWTTPSLDEARGYGSIVLEIQVPVKWLVFGAKRKEEVSNLEEIHERFESPQKFHSYLSENWSRSGTTFKINREIPVHYVRGGWDMERHDNPEFFPLYSEQEKDLIDVMKEVDGEKIPENPSITKNWKDSDEIVKQRKSIERALQHDYKIDEKEMDDLLEKVKAGEEFTYSDYLSFFNQLEELSDKIRDDLNSIRKKDGFTEKHWIQNTLFSINKVMEKMKREFNQDYSISEVEDGEELLEKVSKREKILENHSKEFKKFKSNLMERREHLRKIYNEELNRKDSTPDSIDLKLDTTYLENVLEDLQPFKLSGTFSVSAQFPSIQWLKEQIKSTEKAEETIEEEIKVEDEKITAMRQKYEEDEIVDAEELREEAERLKKEANQMKEVGSAILRIEKGEIDAKEAFEEVDDKRIKNNFHEDVEETRKLVKQFNRELERIKKEAAVLSKISGIQSIHSGGSLTRVSVLMDRVEEDLENIHREDKNINDLIRKI